MKVKAVKGMMTKEPWCCTPETRLQEVARMMVERDCGAIPVVETREGMKPVGIVTDRDITCRTIALGRNPLEMVASDCMTRSCVTVTPETSAHDCCRILEENKLRRAPVVDSAGRCCGIIAQADLVRFVPKAEAIEVVAKVSQPARAA
jgi:CBS domain-containing protein